MPLDFISYHFLLIYYAVKCKCYTIIFLPCKTTQFARENENQIHEVIPKVEVKDVQDLTEDVVTKTLRRAVSFHSTLQCHDGHWPGDYGGPMFLMPGLVSYVFNTSSYFVKLIILCYITNILKST